MLQNLYIHVVDVGQSKSSLLIASNPALGQHRTIPISGGLADYAATMYTYVAHGALLGSSTS